ncbi:thioesterase domain-containing protein [Parashewanella tropica]|uniref:thioesterase domain-containing protein n=1 Tax=Parashewanella tropica TaxID=2547970 RepID=UPI00105A7D0F|nr:thioesterase domain-containing protein [Parashewanella tropica]
MPINSTAPLLKELKTMWHNTIPISQAMQITPISYQNQEFIVTAPIDPNINCHQTMFAGSVSTLATLTGWGVFWLNHKLQNVSGDIVLAKADIRYLAPIHSQPQARVKWQEQELTGLNEGRKQRVTLNVEIYCDDTLCATFKGTYVSLPQ